MASSCTVTLKECGAITIYFFKDGFNSDSCTLINTVRLSLLLQMI